MVTLKKNQKKIKILFAQNISIAIVTAPQIGKYAHAFKLSACFVSLNNLRRVKVPTSLFFLNLFYSVLVYGVLLSFFPKVLFPHICIYQPF